MLEELLLAAGASALFAVVVWFMVGLQGSFAIFWLTYYLVLSIGIVLAYFVASASPNMDVANATLPTYVVTLLFFAGFLFRITDIPNYWFWYSRIDFLRYSWGALMRNQFVGEDKAVLTGDDDAPVHVLEFYNLNELSTGENLGVMVAFAFFFFFCALLAMTYIKHTSR